MSSLAFHSDSAELNIKPARMRSSKQQSNKWTRNFDF